MKSYRAKIVSVIPKHRQAELQEHNLGCMIGYSLGNAEFAPAKMAALIAWVDQRFERCAILVGDNIHRIALQIDRGLDEASALREALRIGDERVAELATLIAGAKHCRFTIARCSEMVNHLDYADFHAALVRLHEQDVGFATAVREFSGQFLRRRGEVSERDLALSRSYLTEELAIMACSVRDGFDTFVYPGNLAIAAELSARRHPNAPRELCSMTTVAIDLKARQSANADTCTAYSPAPSDSVHATATLPPFAAMAGL